MKVQNTNISHLLWADELILFALDAITAPSQFNTWFFLMKKPAMTSKLD
jgi:hypothetical protein